MTTTTSFLIFTGPLATVAMYLTIGVAALLIGIVVGRITAYEVAKARGKSRDLSLEGPGWLALKLWGIGMVFLVICGYVSYSGNWGLLEAKDKSASSSEALVTAPGVETFVLNENGKKTVAVEDEDGTTLHRVDAVEYRGPNAKAVLRTDVLCTLVTPPLIWDEPGYECLTTLTAVLPR